MRRLWAAFALTRLLEVVLIILVFVVGGAIETTYSKPYASSIDLKEAVSSSFMDVAWYYVGFGYLFVSGIATMIWWFRSRSKSPIGYMLLNLWTFLAHSAVVILIVYFGFHGSIPISFWVTWFSFVAFNFWVPQRVWQRVEHEVK